jgi:hypothetical protein
MNSFGGLGKTRRPVYEDDDKEPVEALSETVDELRLEYTTSNGAVAKRQKFRSMQLESLSSDNHLSNYANIEGNTMIEREYTSKRRRFTHSDTGTSFCSSNLGGSSNNTINGSSSSDTNAMMMADTTSPVSPQYSLVYEEPGDNHPSNPMNYILRELHEERSRRRHPSLSVVEDLAIATTAMNIPNDGTLLQYNPQYRQALESHRLKYFGRIETTSSNTSNHSKT